MSKYLSILLVMFIAMQLSLVGCKQEQSLENIPAEEDPAIMDDAASNPSAT